MQENNLNTDPGYEEKEFKPIRQPVKNRACLMGCLVFILLIIVLAVVASAIAMFIFKTGINSFNI